jgi:plastocyanin
MLAYKQACLFGDASDCALDHTFPVERTFRIDASRFQYSPAVLQANPGDRVTIDLVAQDVVRDRSIDGDNLAIIADPGQTARLSFIVDRPGSFHFRCEQCPAAAPAAAPGSLAGSNHPAGADPQPAAYLTML